MAILNIEEIDNNIVPPSGVPDVREFKTSDELKTSVIFNKDKELNTILQYISGKEWSVDYFLQLTNVNDTLTAPDLNLPPTVQKYHRINKLTFVVQDDIKQGDIDDLTGSAILNAGFSPNLNDAFIATLFGGRLGLFIITKIEIKTYNLSERFFIEYKLYKFLDYNSDTYNDLVIKTMKEYVYDKEHLLDYSAPIILANDYVRKLDLKKAIPNMLDHYVRNFIHSNKNVLAIPTDSTIYTDTNLTSFLFKVVNHSDHIDLNKISRLDYDALEGVYSIWDVIANRDIDLLKRVYTDIGFKYTPYAHTDPTSRQMGYLGINFVVSKLKGTPPVIPQYTDISIPESDDFEEPTGDVSNYYYVLSESFYKQDTENMGLLELTLTQYLKGEVINYDSIDKLIRQYPMWDTLDQYYFIPILIVLVKDAINNTFKSI